MYQHLQLRHRRVRRGESLRSALSVHRLHLCLRYGARNRSQVSLNVNSLLLLDDRVNPLPGETIPPARTFDISSFNSCFFFTLFTSLSPLMFSLGLSHDSNGNSCAAEGYVMSPSRGLRGESQWSTCSAQELAYRLTTAEYVRHD